MSKLLIEESASASNNASLILKAINSCNQGDVAKHLGVDASTLSRMKNDKKSNNLTDLEFLAGLLSAIGLKVVNANDVYCSPEMAEATRVMLAHAFTSPEYMRILFK
ncbi:MULTISPECIES: helix-turn-helix transcriptional regulator [Acinetobacter]|uniref:helix-turn-helix domain-containing protein n=1 Tax=Acinetobacter TaxID=469 RepID=UPI0012506974|nr:MULTISPECIES: helix-turn-helix transcriptional regulator [Acinetobacter]MDV8155228.1 helix-turn-helix transcriptional regulator [Acinetobacter bereziniae]WEE40975.1 helix-turn-helix transcriptional regulator [Acinetobacter sp. TAC-1]